MPFQTLIPDRLPGSPAAAIVHRTIETCCRSLLVIFLFTCCNCSGSPKGGKDTAPKPKCTAKPGFDLLMPQSFHKYFEKQQAAYFVQEGENLLLAVRVKEDKDTAEVLGKFLALITTKFDFHCDKRKKIIIVCYKGFIEEMRNIGMLISVNDLKLLQKGSIGIDQLSERAKYVEGLDLSSVKPLITK